MDNGVVQQMVAFYDDSGIFSPGQSNFVCLGMVVIPIRNVREYNDAWWDMLVNHFPSTRIATSLEQLGIEVKSSEIHDMLRILQSGQSITKRSKQIMFEHGLDSPEKIRGIIESIYNFISKPIIPMKYLAVCANKSEVWQKFYPEKINKWELGQEQKKLGSELSVFLLTHMYEYLLQRLQYLSKDPDFEFSDSFVVGDEMSNAKAILEIQSAVQAGLGSSFTSLPSILNKSWFGSSLHEPCLQTADWVAFAIRRWAEKEPSKLSLLLPNFRGYPDLDQILGRGIVPCPNKDCFPPLP